MTRLLFALAIAITALTLAPTIPPTIGASVVSTAHAGDDDGIVDDENTIADSPTQVSGGF